MKTINRTLIATALYLCGFAALQAQSQNPFVAQGIISPAPLLPPEFNGTGTASFIVGNTGSSDMPLVLNQEMTLVLSLSGGVPNVANPNDPVQALSALSGTWLNYFTWTYDPAIKTFRGTQNQLIPGSPDNSARGTVIIDYKVTENSILSNAINGFNVNVQPPPYTNGINTTDDDAVSSYTYTQAFDYGDAPSSYTATPFHTINLTKNANGLYTNYVYLGQRIDPELATQASAGASGDDTNQTGGLNVDDEDGITFPAMVAGATATVPVTFTVHDYDPFENAPGIRIRGFIDWNKDNDFVDAGEGAIDVSDIATFLENEDPWTGPRTFTRNVNITVPANSTGVYNLRLRIGPNTSSTSTASYGEIEDHQFNVGSSSADVAIDKVVNNTTPNVGSNVIFTLNASNNGPSPATGVVVADQLPSGYTYVSHSTATGTYNSGSGLWTIGNLGIGGTATLTITATVNASGDYLNTATITATETDPVPGNNTDSQPTNPVPQADLAVDKSVNNGTPAVNSEVVFTVAVSNGGPSTAANVSVADQLPSGYTYVSHTASTGTYNPGSGTWTIGTMNNGASATLAITATVNASGNYLNTATVTTTTNDPNTGNNTDSEPTTPSSTSSVSGTVRVDSNANGTFEAGEPGIAGVIVFLDTNGNGVVELGEPTTTTGPGGAYTFNSVMPGTYPVRIVPATLPSGSIASYDPDGIGTLNVTSVVVGASQTVTGIDFGYYSNGSIGNLVWLDVDKNGLYDPLVDTGIEGVTIELYLSGQTPGVNSPVDTDTTTAGGFYQFSDLEPGSYFIYLPTTPAGTPGVATPAVNLDNQIDNDSNGIQTTLGGPVTSPVVVLSAGESENTIDIGFACQGTWAEWQLLNTLGGQNGATDNPDSDRRDNLLEFALAGTATSGIGDGFQIRPSTTNPGTIEAVFTRPIGATTDVNYILEYASALTTPTTWTQLDVSSLSIGVTPISPCVEEVVIPNLETITGLTGGEGFVRLVVELDVDNNNTPEAISETEVEGWTETPVEICCRTYNNPYLRGPVYTGTVDSVSGQSLVFNGENLSSMLTPGVSYYLEVTSGDNEGHRFDVASASGQNIALTNDTNLYAANAPYNTLLGAPPASLAGDTVILRRHWTLAELFPPAAFGESNDPTLADMVQVFVNGTWEMYWLSDAGDADPATSKWVKMGDNTLADQGSLVIPPGQGVFLNSRGTTGTTLAYGEVRENDFRRPVQTGPNLVAGGFPIDQSLNGTGGRNMNLAASFDGDRDFKKADRVFIWQQDTNPAGGGYDTYFLLDNAPSLPLVQRWVKVGDATIQVQDSATLFPSDRSAFYQMMAPLPGDVDPAPWAP